MSRLPQLSWREVTTALQKAGFVFDRQRGSHMVYYHPKTNRTIVVPRHREILPGTLREIMREAGLNREEFRKLLEKETIIEIIIPVTSVKNVEIAAVFTDIADLLRLKKDNIFKIRAYEKVAKSIRELPLEVAQLVNEGRLKEIPGVGEAIAKKLTELVTTGRLEYYEKLRAEFTEVKSAQP